MTASLPSQVEVEADAQSEVAVTASELQVTVPVTVARRPGDDEPLALALLST